MERGAAAAHQVLDDATRVNSTLVASRLGTLLSSTRPYKPAVVGAMRVRQADLATSRPATIAA
ncbi:hypothetical protein ACH4VR_40270 [Streptomyces sp. NPDC020883]|uniref:hypothetical protein n=1 Tax=Streptomyces sp. NPDC020883 TaxID=3365099 RepID=UPI0037B3A9E4